MNEKELLTVYCKCWNNMDTGYLHPILHEEMTYESQYVYDVIRGKSAYIEYLTAKFNTIRKGLPHGRVTAALGILKGREFPNRYAIVLTQYLRDEIDKLTILIKMKDGLISHIDLCAIPRAESVTLLDPEAT